MTQGTFKFSRPSTSSTSVRVQASEDITSSWCPTLPPRSFTLGLGRRPASLSGRSGAFCAEASSPTWLRCLGALVLCNASVLL